MSKMSKSSKGGWKKYFKVADPSGNLSPISGYNARGVSYGTGYGSGADVSYKNYQSRLPEVYTGHPNRVERYNQYENMDMDAEVNACLDILAEFCTQENNQNSTPFEVNYTEDPTDSEIDIIKTQLQQWCKLNKLDQRIFKLFRNTIKYGDQVFIRDPETFEMYWVDMTKVNRVIVNESEGKLPEQYVIQDINPNFQNLTVAPKTTSDHQVVPTAGGYQTQYNRTVPNSQQQGGRFTTTANEMCIDAEHVIHMSLSEGLDMFWPFGQSILEMVFKVFKQKELLEDAILIYRVQRAPERRVFRIDTGDMPSHLAMQFVERIKNEIHQRRIPTNDGGGDQILDSSYNPLSTHEDYFFPQSADGRGSSVDVLPGGQNLGEIDDLKYFNNKLARGLRVPSSYLPTGPEDSERTSNDGRLGTALIQEHRFNQYCQRLQRLVIQKLDDEFKMFLRWRGFNIDASLFSLAFTAPQNFASYRQAELDNTRISAFQSIEGLGYISKRFALKRFLGLTEEEVAENEKLWAEEQAETEPTEASGEDLRSVGMMPGDIDADIDTADALDLDLEGDDADLDLEAGEDTDVEPDET